MSSLQSFLHMGGYAIYVWPAYGITLIVLVWNVLSVFNWEQRFFRMLKQVRKRQGKQE